MNRWLLFSLLILTVFTSQAALGDLVASDDFQSGTTSGGTGWITGWTSGSNYNNGQSKIDGTRSLGLFGNTSTSRFVTPSIVTTGTTVDISFSFRADWNVFSSGQIGVNVLNAAQAPLLTYKFASGSSDLKLNDGGSDFSVSGITFAQSAIYDFTFTSDISSNLYSFTVDRRDSSESASGNNYAYTGRTTGSFGGLVLFANTPNTSGTDAFFDSISITAVPEPSALLLGGMVCSVLGVRYARRRLAGAKPHADIG
ncbi:hypothetical protein [Bythopirellula polymerisocia]|uniref:PEP-CTERM protein-sorting domain-containing protein n=1 Tax=Bythopirellula polymerisocia TaxID=2528003 RepID=A0A5C6CN14_9BACT|nr:hypothetical protein [Bythopirellula polymerisocia]TWU25818.1 hypothetical protein Pla144_30300 [Bythopirellula polymerisocia]